MNAKNLCGILLLFLCTISFISCSDDEESSLEFNEAFLKQTQWTGTLDRSYIWYGEKVSTTHDVGFIFYTESEGKSNVDTDESNFQYSIDERMLIIINGDSYLNGHWLLTGAEKDKLVLENSTGGEDAYKAVLTLTRKN